MDMARCATSPSMQRGAWLYSFVFLGGEFAFERKDWVKRGIGRELSCLRSPQPPNGKLSGASLDLKWF